MSEKKCVWSKGAGFTNIQEGEPALHAPFSSTKTDKKIRIAFLLKNIQLLKNIYVFKNKVIKVANFRFGLGAAEH